MKKSIKTYTNITWLPANSTIDIINTNAIKNEYGKSTSVFSFIFNQDKSQILLLEHANKIRGYDVPGGHIDPGETISIALHREIMEETGAIVKNEKIIGIQLIKKDKPEDKYPDLISNQVFFVSTLDTITTNELASDSLGIQMVGIEEYKELLNTNQNMYLKELLELALTA